MASVDLKDPDLYLHGVPYATFAALRKEASLHWNPESDGAGFSTERVECRGDDAAAGGGG